MATSVIVLSIGLAAMGAALACVFMLRRRRIHARLTDEGFQEFEIVVRGRYVPDSVRVRRGIPLRLYFRREEDAPCSEQVIFSDFNAAARLPARQSTMVSFIPTKCGEFLFTCALGVYLGRLIVVEPSKRELGKVRNGHKTEVQQGNAAALSKPRGSRNEP